MCCLEPSTTLSKTATHLQASTLQCPTVAPRSPRQTKHVWVIARIPRQNRNALRCEVMEWPFHSNLGSASLRLPLWRCAHTETIRNSALESAVPCLSTKYGAAPKLQPDHVTRPRRRASYAGAGATPNSRASNCSLFQEQVISSCRLRMR